MANIALVRKYATMAAYWADVQSFMTGAGWTLHDDIDANNKVYKTNGTLSQYPYIYLKLTNNTTDRVSGILYLYWNASTHVGSVNAYYTTTYNYCKYMDTYEMSLVGNSNCVSLINYSDDYAFSAGFPDNLFYPEITTISGAVTAGTSVDLPVVSTTDFIIGQKIQIVGVDYEGRDQLTVTNVQTSSYITVENLPRDYALGAFVGVMPCPGGSATSGVDLVYVRLLCSRSAIGTTVNNDYVALERLISYSYIDPDQSTNCYALLPYIERAVDYILGDFDLGGMCKYGALATKGDVFGVYKDNGQPEQGASTTITSTTLYDAGKSWGTNDLVDRFVIIVDGTAGVGLARKILSNSSDTLVVNEWGATSVSSSVYRICDTVYRYWGANMLFLEDRETL